jgi:hypothetical protein
MFPVPPRSDHRDKGVTDLGRELDLYELEAQLIIDVGEFDDELQG